jgi:cell wall-associated NlpC family hydrolase
MARQQQSTLSDVKDKVTRYNNQKRPLDALIVQLTQQDADLAAKKKAIQAQLNQLEKLRLQAYGSSGGVGGTLKPVLCPQLYIGGAGGKAAKYACDHIGKRYVFAADGPDTFDCSGLTKAAWAAAGVSLYHQASAQQSDIRSVSRSALRPGDLVFYGRPAYHVGIYIGNDWIVHAPHPGDHVREGKITEVGSPSGYGRP